MLHRSRTLVAPASRWGRQALAVVVQDEHVTQHKILQPCKSELENARIRLSGIGIMMDNDRGVAVACFYISGQACCECLTPPVQDYTTS